MSQHIKLWTDLGLNVQLHEKLLASMDMRYNEIILSQTSRPKGMAYFDKAVHESPAAVCRKSSMPGRKALR